VVLGGDAAGRADLIVFALLYVLTGLGVTVGFASSCALGPAAIEGRVVSWVADHRKHFAFSDRAGGPHSLHVDHVSGGGERCASS
jgi:stearoyl-CoA desaturase (delta-9 desaturase)